MFRARGEMSMSHGSLRQVEWPRFLKAPDGQLVAKLYEPGLSAAVRYERCCAYFSSSVLSAAASGFGAFISRILTGEVTQKPALFLLVNEELPEADVEALLHAGQDAPLIQTLLEHFGTPANALQKRRLEMLGWLVREGWLDMRVGIMRLGGGILHAKFGIFTDSAGNAVVFAGSGNESAHGVRGNYEQLEISESWNDPDRQAHFLESFTALWNGTDPAVKTVPLPKAVADKLIKMAPFDPPISEGEDDLERRKAAMLWFYTLAAPFMPEGGAATSDAMAPVTMWPHQQRVVSEVAAAWPAGRLLCDEVGMGKTVEAILALRRLLAGRGVRRVLILPPANLLPQWQGELREKGGLRVPRLEGPKTLTWPDGTKQAVSGVAEALEQDILLMSRETARSDGNAPILMRATPWDVVLVDEGHAARRASQIEGEFNAATLLLGLLRQLQAAGQARGFMILSATPMQTHPWEPWDLMQVLGEGGLWMSGFFVIREFYEGLSRLEAGLLTRAKALRLAEILTASIDLPPLPAGLTLPSPENADAFAEALSFLPHLDRERAAKWLRSCSPISRRMHRNTRATLRRYYEMGMLDRPPAKRQVQEDPFGFETEEEREVYDAVAHYIDRRFAELEHQQAGKGFVMTIYRRRAASSPVALQKSLERRATGLKAVIAQRLYDSDTVLDVEDAQELEELLNLKLTPALPDSPAEAATELHQVERLLEKIESLGGLDTKRDRLISWVKQVTADGRSVLVFTSYADTMIYLRDALATAVGGNVASYSGDGGAVRVDGQWSAASKEQVTKALQAGKVRVLVCTDAASEGLNLQAAGALINFDLPWNPSKVEQRIGRVDRIGQTLPVLPIVNLYLTDSIDQQVYRALNARCGLFETFVGPMQPVLSRALRMLMGREHFDESALARAADEIREDPTLMQAFPEDEPTQIAVEPPLVRPEDTGLLLSALAGSGITVVPETNSRQRIGAGPLQIVTNAAAVADHPDAATLDGLDPRQWALLRQLLRPGERLPLCIAEANDGPFRVMLCAWVDQKGVTEIQSLANLRSLTAKWDGTEPSAVDWNVARITLEGRAAVLVEDLRQVAYGIVSRMRREQLTAARLRLVEELGRLLVCSEPDTDDFNGKFYRLASQSTPTAMRLKRVMACLGGYPEWTLPHIAALREFRETLGSAQVKARLTGREMDAALEDPRWGFAEQT